MDFDGGDIEKEGRMQGNRWHPRNWGKKTWIGVIVAAVVVLIAIIVGAVEGVKANRYPNYSKLNYSLQDTCKSCPASGKNTLVILSGPR